MLVQGITRTVSNLEKSKRFYEDILGFEPDAFYIGEPPGSTDEATFFVPDVEALWERMKDKAEVAEPLAMTP
jgi:catechol 2,3-dioxygenase-like lactoylglutathione lyase family enzyme